MGDSSLESLVANIGEWLQPGEKLIEFTAGGLEGGMFDTVIALTDKNIRLGGPAGGRNIPLANVRYVEWKGLWARLNIATSEPKQRLVFAIDGKEWKQRATKLAAEWRSRAKPLAK